MSALYLRGYTVIPEPQRVELKSGDFQFDSGWHIDIGQGVKADDVAIESLKQQLAERYELRLEGGGRGKAVALRIQPGSVEIGAATDANKAVLAEQAYRLELGPDGIRITANAPTGLFYGIETLVQLVKSERGKMWLPEGEIVDWPDVGFREVFWDEQQHLDRLEVLKQAIGRAAFFKVNAIALRLNEHFQYASAPALVNPDASFARRTAGVDRLWIAPSPSDCALPGWPGACELYPTAAGVCPSSRVPGRSVPDVFHQSRDL